MMVQHPRLAWDAARIVVSTSESHAHFVWFSDQVRLLLGPSYQQGLADTRHRLIQPEPHARHVETGAWRLRFDELLRARPDLANPLRRLVNEAGGRQVRPGPYWPIN
jgi:hypothetical protein